MQFFVANAIFEDRTIAGNVASGLLNNSYLQVSGGSLNGISRDGTDL